MFSKKIFLVAFLPVFFVQSFAQTKTIKRKLSPTLLENYEALKADKHVKQGSYVVLDADNHVLVSGQYRNGRKDSIWNFMDVAGNIIQKYNYTDSTLLLNNPDNNTIVHVDYKVADVTEVGRLEAPIQIGGANYGFYLLYDVKAVPPQVLNQTSQVKLTYMFDIAENGKVKACTVTYKGPGLDLTEDISTKMFSEDVFAFLPAKVNGQAVESSLLYTVDMNISKSRLPRQYTSPTSDGSKMSQGIYH